MTRVTLISDMPFKDSEPQHTHSPVTQLIQPVQVGHLLVCTSVAQPLCLRLIITCVWSLVTLLNSQHGAIQIAGSWDCFTPLLVLSGDDADTQAWIHPHDFHSLSLLAAGRRGKQNLQLLFQLNNLNKPKIVVASLVALSRLIMAPKTNRQKI